MSDNSSGIDHGTLFSDEGNFDWEVRDRASTPFSRHAVAGSCAGVMEHTCMYPVDTLKTHMQASPVKIGVGEAVRSVVRSRGMLGLMRGSTVIGAGCVPAHVGFFSVYEHTMAKFVGWENEEHQPLRAAACGGMATVVHDVILTPHDVAKQRLQLGCFNGPLDCLLCIWRQEGLRGFFRSLPVTLVMNVPHMGLLVAANDSLKKTWHLDRFTSSSTTLAKAPWYFACAGISGAFAAIATLPLDVIKTKIQTQGRGTGTAALSSASATLTGAPQIRLPVLPYSGIASTVATIAREEGLRGFFRGLGPRVVLCAPSAGICWGTYETVRLTLQQIAGGCDHPRSQVPVRDWHPSHSMPEHQILVTLQ
jgi:solute carrier family 25 iron transporter 28/37